MTAAQVDIERLDRATHGEYVATLPGRPGTAKLTWTQRGDVRHAEHTFVPPDLRGGGVAGKLVDALIADARSQGFKVSPDCSYVEAAFRRNPEWDGLRA